MTPRAKGGLISLLSHEEGWVRSCIAILQRDNRCGRKQAQQIMAELRDLGYADMVTERREESNLVVTRYTVRAISSTWEADSLALPTYREPTQPVSDPTGVRPAVEEALDEEPLDVETA